MAKGSKTGGRKKGTPNRSTQELFEKCKKVGVDPFEILLYFSKGDWKSLGYESEFETRVARTGELIEVRVIEPELRFKAASKAADFLYAKRKAVELSSEEGKPSPQLIINMQKDS